MDADYLLGRRYKLVGVGLMARPEFTIVAVDAKRVRVHHLDGQREWAARGYVEEGIRLGLLEESSKAPFVFTK